MNTQFSEIKGDDLVLLIFTGDKTGTCHYSRIFYSDGRIAQTDLVINDPKAEIAKIKVPETLREEMKKRGLSALGTFGESHPDIVESQVNQAIWNYQRENFIDKVISDGYLKEYIKVFGRDSECIRSEGLEHKILENKNPVTIFGCRQGKQWENNIWSFSLVKHEIYFDGNKYEMLVPYLTTYRNPSIIIPTQNLVQVVAGAKEIRHQLSDPVFKPLLDTGIIP